LTYVLLPGMEDATQNDQQNFTSPFSITSGGLIISYHELRNYS